MARGTRNSSEIVKHVLTDANAEIVLAAQKAGHAFDHRGIKGDERAAALHQFFIDRLPSAFGVTKGEAVDYKDGKSGQLDLIIYEKTGASPIEKGRENLLLPCESLYAVIEVKSILSADELEKAFVAGSKIRRLRPFKKAFVASRKEGAAADPDTYRCLYIVFALTTNLSEKDWLEKEFDRLKNISLEKKIPLDTIDRLVVLNRGIINPAGGMGKTEEDDDGSVFLEFFFHVVNFLRRESGRRPPVDWQVYTERYAKGWKKIVGA
jgi:hypothetical protein